jgi:hypothetical protein
MQHDAMADAVPTMDLGRVTLIYDRTRQRPLLQLTDVMVVPVGTTLELPAFPRPATVVGVRLVGGGENRTCLCLDVEVAADEGMEGAAEAAVPEPIAAATADLDLDPDAAKPLGTPLT